MPKPSTRARAVALLRGINLGGHNKVSMQALRALFESIGFQDVSTYIQSGNIAFSATPKQLKGAIDRIEAAFAAEFGFRGAAVLRTAAEMRRVVEGNPFAGRDFDPARLAVYFLAAPARPEAIAGALASYDGPEEVVAGNCELYVYFPDGMGRSKLPVRLEKVLGGTATARNWNTVLKLLAMSGGADS